MLSRLHLRALAGRNGQDGAFTAAGARTLLCLEAVNSVCARPQCNNASPLVSHQ